MSQQYYYVMNNWCYLQQLTIGIIKKTFCWDLKELRITA